MKRGLKMKKTATQQTVDLKNEIVNSGYEAFDTGFGTMYLIDKNDYSFHIYHIHTPSEDNQIAGKNGTLTEMYYNLRKKEYFIKRNLKEVKFSMRNVDAIFPKSYDTRETLFNFISSENNKGLYGSAFKLLGAMGREGKEKYGRFFHRLITEHNYYELLYKSGVTEYVIDGYRSSIIVNPNGNSPLEILGLSKTQWKMFKKYDIPLNYLKNNRGKPEVDEKMLNYLVYISKLEEEFGLDGKCKEFYNYEEAYLYRDNTYSNTCLKTAKKYGIPDKKLIRYIYFETDVSQGMSTNGAISTYQDYIRMCEEMEYARFDRYPKFLRTQHDIVAKNYRISLSEKEAELWKEAAEESQKFYYANKGYKIIVPSEPSDLVKEGNVLSHCVGSYIKNVIKKTTTILFLRKADDIDKPLVTIEVRGDKISQARGKMNYAPKEEEKEIIRLFAKNKNLSYTG